MTYGSHVDNAIMGDEVRSDVSATLFLSAPDSYEGGELVLQEHQAERRIKLPPGAMVVYASTNVHRVEPVRRGTRVAAVFWIQSLVREESKREILYDLSVIMNGLRDRLDATENAGVAAVYSNLMRQWADS